MSEMLVCELCGEEFTERFDVCNGCREENEETFDTEIAALREQLAAANAANDRLRHGATIEGDFVCPNELQLADLTAAAKDALHDLEASENLYACDNAEGQSLFQLNHSSISALAAALAGETELPKPGVARPG